MVKKIFIVLIVTILLIGGAYACGTSANPNNSATNTQNVTANEIHMKTHTESTETNIKVSKTVKTKISAEQAKEITKKYIGIPGAYPGNPKLVYLKASGSFKGGYAWAVPIMLNGKIVDGILIDAQTGENLGEC